MALTRISNANMGTVQTTLARMLAEGITSPEVREFAVLITTGVDDKITAVYTWVKKYVRYVPDPLLGEETELFIAPRYQIKSAVGNRVVAGDCDDHALLLASLLGAIGYQARLVAVNANSDQFDHVIAEVYSGLLDKWIQLDTTSEIPLGWETAYTRRIEIVPRN